jgi:hypothetical protein
MGPVNELNYTVDTLFYGGNQFLKAFRLIHGQVSKHFAVETDAFLAEHVYECAIGQTFRSYSCIDTGDPQRAVLSFLQFAAYITILKTLLQYVLGDGINIFTFAVESFCLLEDAFSACPGSDGIY